MIDEEAFLAVCHKYNGNYFIDNCEGLVMLEDIIETYESARVTSEALAKDVPAPAMGEISKHDYFIAWQETQNGNIDQGNYEAWSAGFDTGQAALPASAPSWPTNADGNFMTAGEWIGVCGAIPKFTQIESDKQRKAIEDFYAPLSYPNSAPDDEAVERVAEAIAKDIMGDIYNVHDIVDYRDTAKAAISALRQGGE